MRTRTIFGNSWVADVKLLIRIQGLMILQMMLVGGMRKQQEAGWLVFYGARWTISVPYTPTALGPEWVRMARIYIITPSLINKGSFRNPLNPRRPTGDSLD